MSSPYMSLPIPSVGTTSGPEWSTNLNSCLTLIDRHTHVAGSGAPITPEAININASLSMNNFPLIDLAALTLEAQTVTPSNQSVYVSGVDLYYIDGNGNAIRITQSGSVAGSTGTITGLPSGTASAAYAAGTFVFQSATNTAANIDGGSFILRNSAASSFGLTLSPPTAMGANYALTLPSIPGSTSFMTIDTSGNMSGSVPTTGGITKSMLAALGQQVSSSSGNIVYTGNTPSSALMSRTITTTGRPVFITLQGNDNVGPNYLGTGQAAASTSVSSIILYRGGVAIQAQSIRIEVTGGSGVQSLVPPGSIVFIDTTATAGTQTYDIRVSGSTGTTQTTVINCVLIAYELS